MGYSTDPLAMVSHNAYNTMGWIFMGYSTDPLAMVSHNAYNTMGWIFMGYSTDPLVMVSHNAYNTMGWIFMGYSTDPLAMVSHNAYNTMGWIFMGYSTDPLAIVSHNAACDRTICYMYVILPSKRRRLQGPFPIIPMSSSIPSPYKIQIFPCMGEILCVEFQKYLLKFHTKYLAHTLKHNILQYFQILKAITFEN